MSKSAAGLGFGGGVIRNPILDTLSLKHSLGFQLKILEKKYESAVSNKCLNFGCIFIIFSLLLFLK